MSTPVNRRSPFELEGGSRAVLCLHGFTGTPYEMSFLATSLHRRGYTVDVPLLPGHGTEPRDLNRTTYQQWEDAVSERVHRLASRCDQIAIAGQSMGGLLALNHALREASTIGAVVTLATPLWLPGTGVVATALFPRLSRALTRRLPLLAKRDGSDVLDEQTKEENPSYPVIPLSGVAELTRLMRHVRTNLESVCTPVLVVHGRNDHTAPPACADELFHRVGSEDKRLLMVPRSYHLVACDVERKQVARAVSEFLDRAL